MDFNKIDEVVDKFCGKEADSGEIEERLDQYDIEKLRAIYHRLTNKSGQLLRRHHLCEEIKEIYLNHKNESNKKDVRGNYGLETQIICSWMLEDRSSYREIEFGPNSSIDWQLFSSGDREEFYHKCYDLLVFRSRLFSQIATSHRSLREHECFSELFDLYFNTLYQNYDEFPYLRDWLLILIVGINLFKYHIVKLNIPYQYFYVNQSDSSDPEESGKCNVHIDKFPANLTVKFTYDSEIERLGIFHLLIPSFHLKENELDEISALVKHPTSEVDTKSEDEDSHPVNTVVLEGADSGTDSESNSSTTRDEGVVLLISKKGVTDTLSYGSRYFSVKWINLRYSIDCEKSSEEDRIEEIFSQL